MQAHKYWSKLKILTKNSISSFFINSKPLKTDLGFNLICPEGLEFIIANELYKKEYNLCKVIFRAIQIENNAKKPELLDTFLQFMKTDCLAFPPYPNLGCHATLEIFNFYRKLGIEIKQSYDLTIPKQDESSIAKILKSLDIWEVAALEHSTLASKSLLVSLALIKGGITVNQAIEVALKETIEQQKKWGTIEDHLNDKKWLTNVFSTSLLLTSLK